jgi:hypothetical protein
MNESHQPITAREAVRLSSALETLGFAAYVVPLQSGGMYRLRASRPGAPDQDLLTLEDAETFLAAQRQSRYERQFGGLP